MIAISLALVSVSLFSAHMWDLYQTARPVMVHVKRLGDAS